MINKPKYKMANSPSSPLVSKSAISKWFTNKSLKLSFNNIRRRSKSNLSSSSSSSPSSPISSSPNSQAPKNDTNAKASKEDELRQVFGRFDENGDGKISALELRSYFGSIGVHVSHEQAKAAIDDFDANGDESLDFEEFLKLMERGRHGDHKESTSSKDHDDDDDDDLKSAFEMFELEKGCITPRSVQRMLGRLGDTRSYDECKAMVRAFDKDGNGVLDFNEFHQMMTA